MPSLLAVDLGLRTGLALYSGDGRLRWYRSQNFGTKARLKRGAYGLFNEIENLEWLIVEGGGLLADAWVKEAVRRNISVKQIGAETWRPELLLPREQRDAQTAKASADTLARQVIDWSEAAKPTSLRHDAAEAILIGLWGVLKVGWLDELPATLRR